MTSGVSKPAASEAYFLFIGAKTMGTTPSSPAPPASPSADAELVAEARQICAIYDQNGSTPRQAKAFSEALAECMSRRTGTDAHARFEARRTTPLRVAAGMTDEFLAADLRVSVVLRS